MKSDGQKVFSEVQCAELLLGYQVMNAGYDIDTIYTQSTLQSITTSR